MIKRLNISKKFIGRGIQGWVHNGVYLTQRHVNRDSFRGRQTSEVEVQRVADRRAGALTYWGTAGEAAAETMASSGAAVIRNCGSDSGDRN